MDNISICRNIAAFGSRVVKVGEFYVWACFFTIPEQLNHHNWGGRVCLFLLYSYGRTIGAAMIKPSAFEAAKSTIWATISIVGVPREMSSTIGTAMSTVGEQNVQFG